MIVKQFPDGTSNQNDKSNKSPAAPAVAPPDKQPAATPAEVQPAPKP